MTSRICCLQSTENKNGGSHLCEQYFLFYIYTDLMKYFTELSEIGLILESDKKIGCNNICATFEIKIIFSEHANNIKSGIIE